MIAVLPPEEGKKEEEGAGVLLLLLREQEPHYKIACADIHTIYAATDKQRSKLRIVAGRRSEFENKGPCYVHNVRSLSLYILA